MTEMFYIHLKKIKKKNNFKLNKISILLNGVYSNRISSLNFAVYNNKEKNIFEPIQIQQIPTNT